MQINQIITISLNGDCSNHLFNHNYVPLFTSPYVTSLTSLSLQSSWLLFTAKTLVHLVVNSVLRLPSTSLTLLHSSWQMAMAPNMEAAVMAPNNLHLTSLFVPPHLLYSEMRISPNEKFRTENFLSRQHSK